MSKKDAKSANIWNIMEAKYRQSLDDMPKKRQPLQSGRELMYIAKIEQSMEDTILDGEQIQTPKIKIIMENEAHYATLWLNFRDEYSVKQSMRALSVLGTGSDDEIIAMESIEGALEYAKGEYTKETNTRLVVTAAPRPTQSGKEYIQIRIVGVETVIPETKK